MALEQNEKCPVQIADLVVLADYLVISQDEEQAFDIHFLYGNVGNHFNAHVFYFILKDSIPVDRVKTRLAILHEPVRFKLLRPLCVNMHF